jgi:hypothetical protein
MRKLAAAVSDRRLFDQETPDTKVIRMFVMPASEADAKHPADAKPFRHLTLRQSQVLDSKGR